MNGPILLVLFVYKVDVLLFCDGDLISSLDEGMEATYTYLNSCQELYVGA